MKKLFCILLAALSLIGTVSCTDTQSEDGGITARNLMDGINTDLTPPSLDKTDKKVPTALTDTALALLGRCLKEGENILISPFSVTSALVMLANGAQGDTADEIEAVLGSDTETLTKWISAYTSALPVTEKASLKTANSIWFTNDERFTVNEDFLKTNAAYFGADIYSAPFDSTTVTDINSWVKNATDGMIDSVISDIPDSAIMYLVNALAFEGEWQKKYEKHQVRPRVFTKEDGTESEVQMMYSDEYRYMEDENAVGFLKYYDGRDYAFAALLPNEGVTVAEYIDTISGESLLSMINTAESTPVNAGIPRFSYSFDTELADVLKSLGMESAFSEDTADLSGLGTSRAGNIFVSRVIHKTFIEVAESGTKAGAVTVIETADGASDVMVTSKTVILNRPFLYMIIECETGMPLFMGVTASPDF